MQEDAARVRVRAVASGIFQVTASPDDDFERSASLMRAAPLGTPGFEVVEEQKAVKVVTADALAEISLDTGAVRFLDNDGNEVLAVR